MTQTCMPGAPSKGWKLREEVAMNCMGRLSLALLKHRRTDLEVGEPEQHPSLAPSIAERLTQREGCFVGGCRFVPRAALEVQVAEEGERMTLEEAFARAPCERDGAVEVFPSLVVSTELLQRR